MLTRFRGFISEIGTTVAVAGQGVVSVFTPFSLTGLRSRFRIVASKYWPAQPAYENTLINYDQARQLYRNDGSDTNLGSAFCRPIIDLSVEYIGLPSASVENEIIDDELNTCIRDYWAEDLQQMFRDAMRDSKVIVRIRQDTIIGPLTTAAEREHCKIECIVPERVSIYRNPLNNDVIDKAVITHDWLMLDNDGDIANGVLPEESVHKVIEIITPDDYRYWDESAAEELVELAQTNDWGFVPLLEVWNEFDASLNGGQSDLESCYPFVRAFHDVLGQSLQAHKYHSTPKVVFKLSEIGQFLKNNFADAFDPNTGTVKAQATISWTGKEAIFLQADESLEFLEARSVLGDSKGLLEFLFDCICVASQTPRWAFMTVDTGSANAAQNAQTVPFTKKINKKRINFQSPVQVLLKMYMVILGVTPIRPSISWEAIQPQDQVQTMTALQQLIMGLEVAAQRKIISDNTYREMLRIFIPMMKSPTLEASDAEGNFDANPAAADPANVPAGSNGHGNKDNIPVVAGPQGKNE